MSSKPQNVKGMRDHLPEAMILRQHITNTLIEVFERYGFEPLQTPLVEYAETLEGKIGDEEKLIYRFEDAGGRKLALRYDQTVSLARVVAQYPNELALPWRRYAIGQSYRGERPARGRYREFWQADLDIIGSTSPLADAEIIAVLGAALSELGFSGFTTLINHRQVLEGIARAAGVEQTTAAGIYRSVDKLDKIGPDGVREELIRTGVSAEAAGRILEMAALEGPAGELLDELAGRLAGDEPAQAGIANLRAISELLAGMGVPDGTYKIAPRLSRAFSYYTGVVFESVVETPPMGSLLGGGRYDELIGAFAGRAVPTVGMAFGLERLYDVMQELGMGPQRRTVAEAFVTLFSPELVAPALQLASELRAAGLKIEAALDPQEKLGKQFRHADRKQIPYALVIGPDEQARGEVVLRDMRSGEQRNIARAEVAGVLRDALAGSAARDA